MAHGAQDTDTPGATRNRYRQALKTRDLRLIIIAFLVDDTGSWSYSVVLAAYVFGRTGSPGWVAAMLASRWIAGLIVSGPAGVLADRYDRTRLIVAAALTNAVIMSAMTVLVAIDGPLLALVVLSVLVTVASSANRPAVGALMPEVVSEQDLAAANGLLAAIENLVVLLGPALGGLLLVLGSPATAIGLNAASYLVAAAVFTLVRVRSRGGAERGTGMLRQMADGWQALVSRRVALVLVLFLVLDSAVFGATSVVFGPLSVHLGTGADGFSYLIGAGALGGILGAGLADRLASRPRLAPVIMGALLLECLPVAALSLTDLPVVAAVLEVLFGVGMVVLDVVGITALQREISGELLGRVSSIMFGMIMGANAVASFVVTALLSAFDLTTTLVAIGFGIPILGLIGLPAVLRQDRDSAAANARLEPRIALLSRLDLFTGAARPVLERLAAEATERPVVPGEVVIAQHDPADALYLLADGVLAVTVQDATGVIHARPDVVAPGYVGELGLLRRIPRTATVTATTPGILLRIDAEAFFSALDSTGASRSMLTLAGERFSGRNRAALAEV